MSLLIRVTCVSNPSRQLNLKNDTLRRRFDSLKYDIKKIEEGVLLYVVIFFFDGC